MINSCYASLLLKNNYKKYIHNKKNLDTSDRKENPPKKITTHKTEDHLHKSDTCRTFDPPYRKTLNLPFYYSTENPRD